ncbi:alpha/beta hydrolase fold domain-containing protein [Smaragdicoccus niigatensis]|uniref:alpha/beta hydrolase fold domain-containing protein n=1 Tax=Smaragdicoccus niigatensis TaxID=359359 RepID=UPI000372B6C0|nr:alpha/beta hydrolase fold domain-containing protein [Smaragdicoccus niigatensis]
MNRQIMRAVVRSVVRPVLGPKVPVRFQRRLLNAMGRIAILPPGTRREPAALGGRPAEKLSLPGSDEGAAILYLHGGGYTVGSPVTHRALAAHIAEAAAVPVYTLDYRLAPEHPFPAALDDALAAYRELLASGRRVAVAGDSAGGGLALALVRVLLEQRLPAPAGLALISPWVDLRLDHVRDDSNDPMLRLSWLKACADRYAGDLSNPKVSPIQAFLDELPPTLVQASEHEILRADIERFVTRTDAEYRVLDGLWHVTHLHAGLVPEATAATFDIGLFLGQILQKAVAQ